MAPVAIVGRRGPNGLRSREECEQLQSVAQALLDRYPAGGLWLEDFEEWCWYTSGADVVPSWRRVEERRRCPCCGTKRQDTRSFLVPARPRPFNWIRLRRVKAALEIVNRRLVAV